MDNGPEIEIELYESPRPSPQAARGADKAAAMPPAQLAFAAYCLIMAVVAWARAGARIVGAMTATERDAWRVSRGLAPLTVAAPAPAPTAADVDAARLRLDDAVDAVRYAPDREGAQIDADAAAAEWRTLDTAYRAAVTAPAVDPLTEAREARAAWETADLKWVDWPRVGWAAFVSPFTGWSQAAKEGRERINRAGAQWDKPARVWQCRTEYVPAVNAAIRAVYGRDALPFVDVPRYTAQPAPAARTATPPRGVPVAPGVATWTPPAGPRGARLPIDVADLPPRLAARTAGNDVAPALAAALGETTAPAPTERQAIPTVTASASDNAAAIERLALASRARRANGGGRRTVETPEQRERRERLAADIAARRTLDNAITVALAGNPDGEYPHGCLAAWHPSGEVRWSVVADAAAAAGVSPPAERSLRAIAADAVRTIEGGGLRVSVVKRGSRWAVYRPARVTEAGASVGEAQVVAELQGDALVTDGPEDLCATVRDAFDRARREAVIGSAEVTAWLTAICHQLRGVSTVYGRWIPPGRATDTWRRVTEALNAARLPLPSRPAAVASRADVAEEIAGGLRREIEAEVARIAEDAARENYGTRAAVSALVDLAALRDKARMYAVITGPGALDAALAQMDALAAKLEPLADDTSQRGAALELY